MGCKGRARPLHARASGTSVRITCDFHEHGTCALHTARPGTRTCSVFPQRIYLTGTSHRNRRENKDDAKPLHNRERQPLRENKNKNSRIFATFLRLGIPFPFPQSENRQFYGQLSAFSRPDSRFGTTQQSAIAKKLQFEPFFLFSGSRGGFRTAPWTGWLFWTAPWEAIQAQRHEAAWMQHREGRRRCVQCTVGAVLMQCP